jgi:hypothetical protein
LLRWWLVAKVGTGRHLLDGLKHDIEHGTASPRKRWHVDRAAARPRPNRVSR